MITRIQALNYRCLRYIDQSLEPFQVLVGPNASGKTTFLDVISFLGTLVSKGIDEAIGERTSNFDDLVWGRERGGFELAIEARIPEQFRSEREPEYDHVRYEIGLRYEVGQDRVGFTHDKVSLISGPPVTSGIGRGSDRGPQVPKTLFGTDPRKSRNCAEKVSDSGARAFWYFDGDELVRTEDPNLTQRGLRSSVLKSVLPIEGGMLALWLLDFLTSDIHSIMLNSLLLRKASPPGQGRAFRSDGSNLPWIVEDLLQKSPDNYAQWIAHLRTSLPDLAGVRVVERPDDKHKYLMLKYDNGLEVPSWMTSDGTLRLLALTLPAYLPEFSGVYMIEEPENGIHPRATETLFQSLSSVYNAQTFLATHSPVILSHVKPEDVLCFTRNIEGDTTIVRGDKHPALQDWKRDSDLGLLLASGVLG